MPPSGAYAYGAGVVADTLLNFLKEAPCHDVLCHFYSGLATLTRCTSVLRGGNSYVCFWPLLSQAYL